jgi:hypothetical protein
MKASYKNHIHHQLCTLFLNTVFSNPLFIKKEISKHLELSEENVQLGKPEEKDEIVQVPLSIEFEDVKEEFLLVFKKRVEPSREIEVPKVVNEKRKWWQSEGSSKVIVEKHKTKERPYLLLTEIK